MKAKFGIAATAPDDEAAARPPNTSGPARTETPIKPQTIAALADCYFTDKRSPFHSNRFRTRQNYKSIIGRVVADAGRDKLADLNAERFQALYDKWTENKKMVMARAQITMLRLLFKFGATTLNDHKSDRLSFVLHKMRFARPKPQNEQKGLSREDAIAIVRKAHEMGFPSIALAQAFEFECRKLRQKDVIGEWLPLSEQTKSGHYRR